MAADKEAVGLSRVHTYHYKDIIILESIFSVPGIWVDIATGQANSGCLNCYNYDKINDYHFLREVHILGCQG